MKVPRILRPFGFPPCLSEPRAPPYSPSLAVRPLQSRILFQWAPPPQRRSRHLDRKIKTVYRYLRRKPFGFLSGMTATWFLIARAHSRRHGDRHGGDVRQEVPVARLISKAIGAGEPSIQPIGEGAVRVEHQSSIRWTRDQ